MKNIKEILKKNLTSIICAVFALAGIGAIFWPINGKYAELQEELANRQKLYGDLQKSVQKTRTTPAIPGISEEPGKLASFPTKDVINKWQAVTEQVKAESKQMFDTAVAMNRRPVLTPRVLPDTSVRFDKTTFRKDYKNQMDLSDETVRKTGFIQKLRPGFMPTEAAKNEAKNRREQELLAETPKDPTNGNPLDPNFNAMVLREKDAIPEKLNAQVAESSLIYVDLGALDPQPADMLNLNAAVPDAGPIYVAQVNYWIQKDVIDSLAEANKGAKNVKDAPVKHLWKIKFAAAAFTPLQATTAPPDAAGQTSEPTSEWKPNFSASPTGRATNGAFDVYRFALRVFVDADRVNTVLRELTRGKLINVLACDVVSRDTSEYLIKGYYYGDKPIVQLDVQCEALLLRDWTMPLMPPSVRTALGIKAAAAGN